jgi:tRNA-uridine 2-sulfurtransferase
MKTKNQKTILIGLSGGVDSSVSAALLKQQGYEVIGVTMKLWSKNSIAKRQKVGCYGSESENNVLEAKKAAQILGISHIVVDVSKEFEKYVLTYFKKEYLAGRTPNPCVKCNQKIKFGYVIKKISDMGVKFDFFATGHYARIKYDKNKKRYLLLKGLDNKKDQSYFLYQLSQKQLSKTIFPLGSYRKEQVKKLAKKFGLGEFANKAESQDFGAGEYANIIGKEGKRQGKIIDTNDKVLGSHNGLVNFTIGQRKGINIGGLKEPYYVIGLNGCRNEVIVGKKQEAFSKDFKIKQINWIAFLKLQKTISAKVKIRSAADLMDCKIIPQGKNIIVRLVKPAFAITKGQSAVFYLGDIVLGGGIIE